MRIAETRVYRGPNVWRPGPAIALLVETGELAGATSAGIPGFADRFSALLASWGTGDPLDDGFGERVRLGVGFDAVVLHLATELPFPDPTRGARSSSWGRGHRQRRIRATETDGTSLVVRDRLRRAPGPSRRENQD